MIRVFPRRTNATPTDEFSFVGDPPLLRPDSNEVHISITFTWDRAEGERLASAWGCYYPKVLLGGPAFDDPGADFVPGHYLKPGYVITSRGCPNRCPWCFVPRREGALVTLSITEGWNVIDNNLLACSWPHIEAVGAMLRRQPHPADFTGGLDARLVNDRVIQWLQGFRLRQLFLAYDHPNNWKDTERAITRLRHAGLTLWQVRCFVLIGQNGDSVGAAEIRCRQALEAGALPFAMLYRDEKGKRPGEPWRSFQRSWARPAAILARRD